MGIDFLITSLIVIVSPGTGVLFTLATGISRGARASMIAALGCTLGIVPHMAAAVLGLAALLHTSALAFQIMKYLGVAYLLYMAWTTLKERGALRVENEIGARPASQIVVSAILINILNPKLSIFFLAFLPQFVGASDAYPVARMLELSGVFMLLTFVVFAGYGMCAASIRNQVISRPRVLTWMRRTFAGAFALLGARLALAERYPNRHQSTEHAQEASEFGNAETALVSLPRHCACGLPGPLCRQPGGVQARPRQVYQRP